MHRVFWVADPQGTVFGSRARLHMISKIFGMMFFAKVIFAATAEKLSFTAASHTLPNNALLTVLWAAEDTTASALYSA